jgi:hypothetical protein
MVQLVPANEPEPGKAGMLAVVVEVAARVILPVFAVTIAGPLTVNKLSSLNFPETIFTLPVGLLMVKEFIVVTLLEDDEKD